MLPELRCTSTIPTLPSSCHPYGTKVGFSRPRSAASIRGEQLWGRAVRASRNSQTSFGTLLFGLHSSNLIAGIALESGLGIKWDLLFLIRRFLLGRESTRPYCY